MKFKKRGYFFVLDAVLGLFILVIGVFLISSSYVNIPEPTQVGFLSDDLLKYLSGTKIKELNNPYAGIGGELWEQGLITEAENSLLQQIGEFYAKKNIDISEKFIENVSKEIMPPQYLYELWINDVILYPKVPSSQHLKSKDSTEILLTSRTITFGIINKTTGDIWGPYKVEVFAWQK